MRLIKLIGLPWLGGIKYEDYESDYPTYEKYKLKWAIINKQFKGQKFDIAFCDTCTRIIYLKEGDINKVMKCKYCNSKIRLLDFCIRFRGNLPPLITKIGD